MLLSKTGYRIFLEIGRSKGNQPLSVSHIASELNIPEEHVLAELRKLEPLRVVAEDENGYWGLPAWRHASRPKPALRLVVSNPCKP